MWPREFISERECMHVGSDYDLPPCILTGAHSLCKQDLLRIFLLFQFVCFFLRVFLVWWRWNGQLVYV